MPAATETERELDRVWKALDDATLRIQRIEARERDRVPQHAPAPDYRVSEPAPECTNTEAFLRGDNSGCEGRGCPRHEPANDPEPADEPERCSCEEAVALRAECERLRADADAADALLQEVWNNGDIARKIGLRIRNRP